MTSTAKAAENQNKNSETPSNTVLSPSKSRATRRALPVQPPSEGRATRRARTAQPPSEISASGDASADQQAITSSAPAMVASRPISIVKSQPRIRHEVAEPHAIDIYALPNYATDRRTDSSARILLGQLPGGSDLGMEIYARYGIGHYWLIERDAQSRLGKQMHFYMPPPHDPEPVADDELIADDEDFIEEDESSNLIVEENFRLRLELAKLKERDRVRAEMQPPLAAPPAPSFKDQLDLLLTLDELRGKGRTEQPPPKSLLEQLQELKQAEALLTPKPVKTEPIPQAAPSEPADPRVTVLQMLLDDPDSAKGMASKLRGLFSGETELPPEPQTTFWDFAMSAMENLAPVLPALVQRFVGATASTDLAEVEPGQASHQEPPPTKPRTMTSDEHFEQAGKIVIDGMLKNSGQAQAADALKSVIDRNRTYAPTVIGLMKLSPEQVIEQLKPLWAGQQRMADKLEQPHVIQWMADVIERVRELAGIEPAEASGGENEPEEAET